MKTPPCDGRRVSDCDGVSRRAVMGAGAAGLALAMLVRNLSVKAAQDATPEAEGGMPGGVEAFPLIDIPVPEADVPAGGFKLSYYRVTLEPGAVVPNSTLPYPSSLYVESGVLICPGAAPRFLIRADGSVEEVGDEDVTVNTGDGLYVPPNVLDGGRNDGTDKVSILLVDLIPLE